MPETYSEMKAQAFSFLLKQGPMVFLLAIVAFGMWKMIDQNDADVREELKILRGETKDCNNYNRNVLETIIRENTEVLKENTIVMRDIQREIDK